MKLSKITGSTAFAIFVSGVASHSEHVNHTNETAAKGGNAFVALASSYPPSTILVALAELGIGLLLLAAAYWHFFRTS